MRSNARAEVRADDLRNRLDAMQRDLDAARASHHEAVQAADARKARGAAGAAQGSGAGGVGMAAADDMRRIVRRASWRPEAVLRRLWARMRASWWHGWGLLARLGAAWRGE